MPFPKGKSGNPKGKEPGTKARKTIESIRRIEFVLSILEETIEQDVKKLKPGEKVKLWNDLQEYIRPKLARTEIKQSGEVTFNVSLKKKNGKN